MNQRTHYQSIKFLVGISAVIVAASGLSAWGNPPAEANVNTAPNISEPEVLMQAKLTSSKRVLEGLLRRDYDSIARAAREMKRISQATAWPRPQDEVYSHFSTEFQRQCNELESHADMLNHEAAKFTYMHMTTTCINCHEYIRDSRRVAGLEDHSGVRPIPSHWPNKASQH